jgi:hypothetical protein
VISTADEATKSHTVRQFLTATSESVTSALIVLKHVDALVPRTEKAPAGLIALLSSARVPRAMTANGCCFKQSSWLKIVRCEKVQRPFNILGAALWIRGTDDGKERLHGIVDAAEGDVRRSALQTRGVEVWMDLSRGGRSCLCRSLMSLRNGDGALRCIRCYAIACSWLIVLIRS